MHVCGSQHLCVWKRVTTKKNCLFCKLTFHYVCLHLPFIASGKSRFYLARQHRRVSHKLKHSWTVNGEHGPVNDNATHQHNAACWWVALYCPETKQFFIRIFPLLRSGRLHFFSCSKPVMMMMMMLLHIITDTSVREGEKKSPTQRYTEQPVSCSFSLAQKNSIQFQSW